MQRSDQLKASPPMFQSRFLDRFTRVHPVVPVLIYTPVIAVMLVLAATRDGWWDTAGLLLIGYAAWTLFEYWLHRLVFHFEPDRGIGARLHWMIHGVHHDHPNDPMRLVMPPAASIPLAILVIGAMFLIAGSVHAPAIAAGFLIGYLIYDEMHYAMHHHVRSRGSASACGSCICGTTSRTTRRASASARPTGTSFSGPTPSGADALVRALGHAVG